MKDKETVQLTIPANLINVQKRDLKVTVEDFLPVHCTMNHTECIYIYMYIRMYIHMYMHDLESVGLYGQLRTMSCRYTANIHTHNMLRTYTHSH